MEALAHEHVVQVTCGRDFTLVLCASGRVYAFGIDDNGQCVRAHFAEAVSVWQRTVTSIVHPPAYLTLVRTGPRVLGTQVLRAAEDLDAGRREHHSHRGWRRALCCYRQGRQRIHLGLQQSRTGTSLLSVTLVCACVCSVRPTVEVAMCQRE